jgi:hypothetical protein
VKKKTPSKAKPTKQVTKTPAVTEGVLTGWPNIAKYLGQPISVAQHWAKTGMPVQRKGRSMTARPEELSKWLAKESGAKADVHITQTSDEDLLAELRRGLQQTRAKK